MAASDELKKLRAQIESAKKEIENLLRGSNDLEKNAIKSTDAYKEQVKILKEANQQLTEMNAANQRVAGILKNESLSIKSLTGLQKSLTSYETQRLQIQQNISAEYEDSHEAINNISSSIRELASMTAEDELAAGITRKEIETKIGELRVGENGITQEIIDNLNSQLAISSNISNLTERQRNRLEQQLAVYEGIQDSIAGVLDTASLMLNNTTAGFGMLVIAAGSFIGKLGEIRREFGGISDSTTGLLSFIDENAISNTRKLTNEFGGLNNISNRLKISTSLISATMGVSGEEAAGLIGSFSRLNGSSEEVALNLVKSTQQFAKQNNVIPADVMQDLAGAAEEFALFGKEGGKNLIEAATYARKLGTDLKTVTNIGDTLLDFESSISKELEASVILGRELNLNEARRLFYMGEEADAIKTVLNQLGGISEWNAMDRYQKQAVADLLNTQVGELQKMIVNTEQVDELSGSMANKFSLAGEAIRAGMNKYLGTTVQGIGGALIAIGQMGTGLTTISSTAKGVFGKISSIFYKIKKSPVTDVVDSGINKLNNQKKVIDNLNTTTGSINMRGMVQGAAAILILSGAMFVAGKAFQEFADVEWPAVFMGIAAIIGLAAATRIMSTAGPALLYGAGAITILGLALVPLGYGLSLVTPLVEAFGNIIIGVFGKIPPIIDSVANGISLIINSLSLEKASSLLVAAGGFTALSGSIAVLAGSLSLLANPLAMTGLGVLAGLSTIAGGSLLLMEKIGILGDGEVVNDKKETISNYQSQMLSKMDTLITEVSKNRDVYLDKDKVTSLIRRRSERDNGNLYGVDNQ